MKYLCLALLLLSSHLSTASFAGVDGDSNSSNGSSCRQTISLPTNQWQQISLPCKPGGNGSVTDVFGDDITEAFGTGSADYGENWVVFRFDSNTGYVKLDEAESASLIQGTGYWIIQKSGKDAVLDLPDGSTPTPVTASDACIASAQACFEISLSSSSAPETWAMIGYPFETSRGLADVRIRASGGACSAGCDLNTAEADDIAHNQLWSFNGSSYIATDSNGTLNPWTGYWVATLTQAEGTNPALLIPASTGPGTDAELELYGTFHSMGVVVTIANADDPDKDAIATLEYRHGSEGYSAGFPLTRVSGTRFVGSMFSLQAQKSYDVRVTMSDPDGDPLDGTIAAGTATTRTDVTIPAASNRLVVAPDGSGTVCGLDSPCALSEGIEQAHAGAEVVLRGGTYYQGEFTLPRSGAAGAPIVIKAYANETAILDGADPDTFVWVEQGAGVYRTTVNSGGTHLVTTDGERLYPYQSLADLRNLIWDIPGFYIEGTSLFVHLTAGANPGTGAINVSRYNHAFNVSQDYIYFSDLTFRHYGQGDYAKAIYFNNASENLVQNSIFAINDIGIGIKRNSHRNVFQDNEFYDTNFMWPWDAVKSSSQLETGGITVFSPSTGRGTVVRRNIFHDYFDGIGTCPEDDNGSEPNETDVYENLIYNIGDDGISADGVCSNVRLWNNTFHDVLVGISLAPVFEGPLYAFRNLIYRTGAGNSQYRGYPFKFNSGSGKSGKLYLFHNTADAVLPGNHGFDIRSPGSWELIYSRNNIWIGSDYALNNANTNQPIDFDYDNFYTTLPGEFALWAGQHLTSLPEFQVTTGQDSNGFSLAPGFANAASGNYALSNGSNMVDKGILIPGINADYRGAAPDIGAFESAN